MKKWIKIKSNFIGYHSYPYAPENVAFLRNVHRHIFGVSVKIEILDDLNRELEFFTELEKLNRFLKHNYEGKTFTSSCEMIAQTILDNLLYLDRKLEVEVDEDGENAGGSSNE